MWSFICVKELALFFKVDRFHGNDSVLIPWERRMREVRLHGCFIMNSCQGYYKYHHAVICKIQLGNNFHSLIFCIHISYKFKTLQQSLLYLPYVRKSLKLK